MEQVAILGLGLMGGSLGAALKARPGGGRVTAYARREATRTQALELGCADAVFDRPAEAVRGADVVVCCVPILSIPDLVAACREGLKPGCVVTDVGSTKLALAGSAEAALAGTGARFIGSHPIAGSERQGIEAGHGGLYEGATVVITPGQPDAPGLDAVERLWSRVGARVVVMDPARHDRLLARTSHLPHLVASALALTVGRGGQPAEAAPFCGPGFRDTTRVAEGSPDVWLDIVQTDKVEVVRELRAFLGGVEDLVRSLEADDFDAVYAYLQQGKALRETLTRDTGNDVLKKEAPPTVSGKASATVEASRGVHGSLEVPGDKSISHRVAILSALADGASTVTGFLESEDCLHTLRALEALGVSHAVEDDTLVIEGNGGRFDEPRGPLDCGNSGTGMRLLAGLLAGLPFDSVLVGDDSLSQRPMGRIRTPLEQMGAAVELTGARGCPPIRISGGGLRGIDYTLPVASAQVKSCILLAALFSEGETVVTEPRPTRDHTERLLSVLDIPVTIRGSRIHMEGYGADGPGPEPAEWYVPGDFSSAAFWLVAAAGAEGRP